MARLVRQVISSRRPGAVQVRTLVPHVYLGRRYRKGELYKRSLRLAAPALTAGEIELVRKGQHDWWAEDGRILQAEPGEATPLQAEPTPGSLRILMGTGYDPGNAAYRYHSAVNECSIHASAFVRWADTNKSCSLRQIDVREEWDRARAAFDTADVLHCHVDYALFRQLGYDPRAPLADGQTLVRHYHGSKPTGTPHPVVNAELDDRLGAVLVGARLTLVEHREPGRMHWLPITVPTGRYRNLRQVELLRAAGGAEIPADLFARPAGRSRPFRVAHSPTVRRIKGTAELERAVHRLKARGLPIQLVLIENMQHGEALAAKATCDAVFDSFWLGVQGSGLEGGAMGLPVIAGDEEVRSLYTRSEVGYCPYTFAGDGAALTEVLERLATDDAWRRSEAERMERYVREYHDYSSVAARYDRILQDARATTPREPDHPHDHGLATATAEGDTDG